ncbi:cytoskeleton protein RodZ [Marinobacter gudaonensis]|uniref:Cytoskeleton protein RodZ n=1 Tax=Marinobacter gudaonensis TaxID=375760 RepID=A0A1I6G7V6_9GAMM|nr:RodZ domain-containing protein [Marinobacter gudaonensis]SFR38283.1 cytoskeleton protein RodZ [Marinobacter gudaonensis]
MATEENEQPVAREPVGQQLQKAREQAGLSVSDIARAQHLRPSVIQAIEAGDHSKIDSELFLKGYVRAYAKQVGLDADAVIANLDQELEPLRVQKEQEQEANPLVDIERRRRRKRQLAKVLFLLVVLGVASYLVFSFVLPQDGSDVTSPEAMSEPQSSVVDPGEGEAAGSGSAESASEPVADSPSAQSDLMASESASEFPAQETAVSEEPEASASTAVEVSAVDSTIDIQSTAEEEAPAEEMQAEEAPVSEPIPQVVQSPEPVLEDPNGFGEASDSGRLQIVFNGDCWVQVSDSTGNRLVNSLQRDGDRIDVTGAAPLRVVIGAVDAVESIRFEGEPVDIDGFRVVNNRTEFTLTL